MIETQRQVAPMPRSGGQMTEKEKRGEKERKERNERKKTYPLLSFNDDK